MNKLIIMHARENLEITMYVHAGVKTRTITKKKGDDPKNKVKLRFTSISKCIY